MESIDKLYATTLQSHPLTHSRLKYLSTLAQTSEDHISRLALALSVSNPPLESDWIPTVHDSEKNLVADIKGKHLRGRTLFKDDLELWMALLLRDQQPVDYEEWRLSFRLHWERGVEVLMGKALENGDWLRTMRACIPA